MTPCYDDWKSTDPADNPVKDGAWERAQEELAENWRATKADIMVMVHEHAHALELLANEIKAEFDAAKRAANVECQRIYGESAESEWEPEDWNLAGDIREIAESLSEIAVNNGAQIETNTAPQQV